MGKLKILVLGDGLLGKEIVKQTKWDCLSRKTTGFDICDIEKSIPNDVKIDVIINCIANTDTYSTERKGHWDTNFAFVSDLIKYCNSNLIKLVHISTDYVYSGSIEKASENDVPVHCNNWYGYTKLLGDALVQLECNDHLLIRCTHKPKPFPYEKAWDDQVGNFDYVDVIASKIIKLIRKNANGLYNVGTPTKTIFELASQTSKVEPIKAPSHVPHNTSMNISKMEELLDEGLNKPFFSITIPTYGYDGKGVNFLDHNLEILSKQTFKDFEVVISDHSIDDTIKTICNKWTGILNIKYFRNEYGRGMISPNLNVAMKHSIGKWIKILFQDDFLYDEHSLQIQYDILSENPEIKWLISTFYHSNDGKTFYRLYNPKFVENIWDGTNTLGNPSNLTVLNKDLIYYDEELNWLVDCEYYYRLYLKYGKPTIIAPITVVNRTHGAGLTDTTPQSLKDKELAMLIERYGQSK
jgi:dTDP-4-dehydrorhamnose reductase